MFDLTGKTALVTGSTQGIGFAIAKTLAEHGAKVFVHGATSIEKCEKASGEIINSVPVMANLSESSCAEKLYEQTGDVDILVLNASVQIRGGLESVTDENFASQFNTNVRSSMQLTEKYMPHMKEQRFGRIIMIGSVNQYKQNPQLMVYAATKSAQMNFVQTMARETAKFGITVNNIAPGVILTPRNEEALSDEEYKAKIFSCIPAGFAGTPKDIAPAALLLCSDEGRYITGTDIIIDGGMHL
jgi:glucose 1-dehydrogenase